jgi:hypothetical protein
VKIKVWLGNVLHNCVAHPLMPFLPSKWGNTFHDWTIKFWPEEPKIIDFEDVDTDTMDEE